MKIGILQTGHSPEEIIATEGDYNEMFVKLLGGEGFSFETYAVVDGIFPAGPGAADAWLITGSKHGAYEAHSWIPPLEALIREIAAAAKPLVGVCFGHQIIAQALGGKVEKFAGGWAIGHQTYEIGGQEVSLNAWHQDQVTKLPEGARVLGHNDHCANAVLAIGEHILTIQPHPEFGTGVIEGLITHRGGAVPEADIARAKRKLHDPVQRDVLTQMMVDTLKSKAKSEAAR